MTQFDDIEDQLDALFEAAKERRSKTQLSPGLRTAVLRDAAEQAQSWALGTERVAEPVATTTRAGRRMRPAAQQRSWSNFFQELGGWPALTGLAASAILGVMIGYSGGVNTIAANALGEAGLGAEFLVLEEYSDLLTYDELL